MTSKQSAKQRVFPTQKLSDAEILQTDSFLLTQVAHNIAIKEITRQVSVQCVERGILLKTVFDSYVKLIDMIFADGFHQRRRLAKRFALVTERQIDLQESAIQNKDKIIRQKEREIEELKILLEDASEREASLK